MKKQSTTVGELITLLRTGNAHVSVDDALKEIPFEKINKKTRDLPYCLWQLAEHIRIAQWDILQFCKGPDHVSPQWPEGYWPQQKKPAENQWRSCLKAIHFDREEMIELLKARSEKLFEPFSYGSGQTLFREALTLADHNSYHTGEIVVLRRLLGIWAR